jgi:hypothetical protein
MSDPPMPGGGVRVIASAYSETVSKGARCRAIAQAGQWPLACLGDWNNPQFTIAENSGPAYSYDTQVAAWLAEQDQGGVRRGDAFEVTNEPGTTAQQRATLRCVAACSSRLRLAGKRVLIPHSIQDVSYNGFIDLLNAPTASTGHCTWEMVDGFVFHSYGTTTEGRIDGLNNLRNALDSADHPGMGIHLTETGWPVDRLGRMNATQANPGTGWPQDGYTAPQQADRWEALYNYLVPGGPTHIIKAKGLKLRSAIYFAYADYNPGATNAYNHAGVVEQDTRASAGPPNYQNASGGGGGWVLHPTPYDGRAKGTGSTFVPGSGPYGATSGPSKTLMAVMRAQPSNAVDLT